MRTFILLLLAVALAPYVRAQKIHFEDLGLPPNSFDNGSDGSGGFTTEDVFFFNDYNPAFMSWRGWSLSSVTDTTTAGPDGQYSSFAGTGAEGTATYAVASAFDPVVLEHQRPDEAFVNGLFVTNTTYSALSMRNGDMFAKAFGGPSGNDPDFFLLTIRGYQDGELTADSVTFYLADYRFADNGEDYILKDWAFVSLADLGPTDSLRFSLTSSDNGAFGMNTPGTFAIDGLELERNVSTTREATAQEVRLFPNPATDRITVDGDLEWKNYRIVNANGRTVTSGRRTNSIGTATLARGFYSIVLDDGVGRRWVSRFLKN